MKLNKYLYYENEFVKLFKGDMETIIPLFDKKFNLILTDIPYNISQKSGGLRRLDYGNWDKQYGKEKAWVDAMLSVLKNTIIAFCGDNQYSYIKNQIINSGIPTTRAIVWEKPNSSPMNGEKFYLNSIEMAVFGRKSKSYFKPKCKRNIFVYPTVSNKDRIHPTQKPLKLFAELVEDCTKVDDIILDPFAGSGTTGIVGCRKKRQVYLIERDLVYCKKIKKRLELETQNRRMSL